MKESEQSAGQDCVDSLEAREAILEIRELLFKKEDVIIGGITTENLDKIDWKQFRNKAKWPMKSGQTIKLKNMKDDHIQKAIKRLERIEGDWSDEITIFKMELNFRSKQKTNKLIESWSK